MARQYFVKFSCIKLYEGRFISYAAFSVLKGTQTHGLGKINRLAARETGDGEGRWIKLAHDRLP
jgi:hypothetical protein